MGTPMAHNLLKSGFDLVVHNRTREREEALAAVGAKRAASPKELAKICDAVLICVSDTPDLEEVVLDAERGLLAGIADGGLIIDCSTVAPDATRRLAATCAKRQIAFVDAPVSGGSEGAQNATLAIMCGGSETDFERARPVLEAVGTTITHVGPSGAGQVAKAVNQVVISGTYQAVAEGMVLAHKLGVDPERVVEAIGGGAAASWVLQQRAGNMIDNQYPLGFRVSLHRKDLRIALDAAADTGVELPVASQMATSEDELIDAGFGDEDLSAIARLVRNAAGLSDGKLDGGRR